MIFDLFCCSSKMYAISVFFFSSVFKTFSTALSLSLGRVTCYISILYYSLAGEHALWWLERTCIFRIEALCLLKLAMEKCSESLVLHQSGFPHSVQAAWWLCSHGFLPCAFTCMLLTAGLKLQMENPERQSSQIFKLYAILSSFIQAEFHQLSENTSLRQKQISFLTHRTTGDSYRVGFPFEITEVV